MGVEGGGIVLYILGVGVAVFKNRLCRVVSFFFFFFFLYIFTFMIGECQKQFECDANAVGSQNILSQPYIF